MPASTAATRTQAFSIALILFGQSCSPSKDAAAQNRSGEISALLKRGNELEAGGTPQDLKDAAALTWLAAERERGNRTADALKQLSRAVELVDHLLATSAGQVSSFDVEAVMRWAHQQDELAYSLCSRHPKDAAVVAFGARVSRIRKAREIERSADIRRRVRQLPNSDATRVQMEQAAEDLSTLTIYSYGLRDSKLVDQLATLRKDLADREAEFARRQIAFGMEMPEMELSPISQGATVDFVAYRPYDFSSTNEMPWGEARYAAFVTVYSVNALPPLFIELGTRQTVDRLIHTAATALQHPTGDPKQATKALHDALVAPLTPHFTEPFGGVFSTIILVPDGDIALVPFDSLWDGKGWLSDRFQFNYALSSRYRDLTAFVPDSNKGRHDVTIFADPIVPPDGKLTPAIQGLKPLPGSRQEADALSQLLGGASVLSAAQATVPAVRAAHPGVLHIATHGIAVGQPATSPSARGVEPEPLTLATAKRSPEASDASLVLSGAGALMDKGARLARGERGVGDSGVLSAQEVLGMDLSGTQLVTLSACQSRVGTASAGAGLYGLPRAFAAAGAETVVGSLWPVDDHTTADLMIRFYGRLVRGQSRGEALRGAMRSLRRSSPHPYYWAPFVLVGAPLSRIYGLGDDTGGLPMFASDELPDTGPTLGASVPDTYALHIPRAWSSLSPRKRWEPIWESEGGKRLRVVMDARTGSVNVWTFEEGSTLHVRAQVEVRRDGAFAGNRDLELGNLPFSRDSGRKPMS